MKSGLQWIGRAIWFAWDGSFGLANNWASVGGAAVIAGVVWTGRVHDLQIPEGAWGILFVALACLGVMWVCIFLARLIYSPIHLIRCEFRSRDELIASLAAEKRDLSRSDLNRVDTWSVSLSPRPLMMLFSDDCSCVNIHSVRLINLSPTQRRVLDFELVLSTKVSEVEEIRLTTQMPHKSSYREALERQGFVNTMRGYNYLNFPVVVEPSSVIEGTIDFSVTDEIVALNAKYGTIIDWLALDKQSLIVTEHISGVVRTFSNADDFARSIQSAILKG